MLDIFQRFVSQIIHCSEHNGEHSVDIYRCQLGAIRLQVKEDMDFFTDIGMIKDQCVVVKISHCR